MQMWMDCGDDWVKPFLIIDLKVLNRQVVQFCLFAFCGDREH